MEERSCVFFLKAYEKLKENFKLQAVCLNYGFVDAYDKYFHFPTKVENQLNNVKI